MRLIKTAAFVLLIIAGFSGISVCQSTVTIDTSVHHQTIFGWGAGLRRGTEQFYAEPPSIVSQIEDLCFNQLHINILRTICEPVIEPVEDSTVNFLIDTAKLNWTYYDYTTKDIYAIERAITVSNGRVNYIFSSNNSAPPWQKTNYNILWGGSILPLMYNEFTDFMCSYILGMQNRYHIRLNGFSAFNEPGDSAYFETLTSPPSQVRDIVINLRQKLDSLEQASLLPHIDIIAPEGAVVSAADIPAGVGMSSIYYLDPAHGGIFADTAAVSSVDIVGTHDYFDQDNTADWAKLKSISQNKPIWVTEVSTSTFYPYDITSKNAVIQAKWIDRSFTLADVRAFAMFSFYDSLPSSGNVTSLVIYNGNSVIIPKRYYGFKQFVNFVLPGYVRVDAASNNQNLYVSSYINPAKDTLVLVAINDTDIVLSNVTFHCPASTLPVLQYETCDVPDHSTTQLDNIAPPVGGIFTEDMQPTSIKTFVILLNQTTGIAHETVSPPGSYGLSQNYPNPFNPSTVIQYQIPVNGIVKLKVVDVLGREIRTLVNEYKTAGKYFASFDASNLASGIYFYQFKSGNFISTKKMLLVK
jgi:O-glycosyl hydrolase